MKGKGTIGSEILEKITSRYKDISLTWLVTGNGSMILNKEYETGGESGNWSEQEQSYSTQEQIIRLLRDKISILESSLADKEKIIRLLEKQAADK